LIAERLVLLFGPWSEALLSPSSLRFHCCWCLRSHEGFMDCWNRDDSLLGGFLYFYAI